MAKIQIKNGRIVDPANNIDQTGDLFIAEGKIVSVLVRPADFTADITIEATNHIVCPGFIDLSVRLRDSSQAHKGTIQSETAAAARSGVTSLCLPPDTSPIIDTPAVAESIYNKAKQANYTQVYPIGALTQQLTGTTLSSMYALKQAHCIAVSNANIPLASLLVLRRAMEYADNYNLLVMYQPNDASLSNGGCINEGISSIRYGLPSIPSAAEIIAVTQCLELVKLTGCRLHFSQISCKHSAIKIQQAKSCGLQVTVDVAMHQLHLTENDIEPFNSAYHVLPPLRTEQDKQHLIESLANGNIDAICSDHQPHDLDAKLGAFPETSPGISALESLLPLALNLLKGNIITLSQAIASLTHKPASILGIKSGALTAGFMADVCIFMPDTTWEVNHKNWISAGQNTPFWGKSLTGQVTSTIQSGEIIYTL